MAILEAMHTIGLCCIVYKVLPKLDMVRAILLMSCIGVLPGMLKMVFAECPKYDKIPENDDEHAKKIDNPKNKMIAVFWHLGNILAVVVQIGTIVYVMIGKSFELTKIGYLKGPLIREGEHDTFSDMYLIPLGLFFVSIRYWENFVDKNVNIGPVSRHIVCQSGKLYLKDKFEVPTNLTFYLSCVFEYFIPVAGLKMYNKNYLMTIFIF